MKKLLLVIAALTGLISPVFAASTINPNAPPASGPLNSGPVRNNFGAAYNDITNILGHYAAPTAPANPINLQEWVNTTGLPVAVFNYYNGTTGVWVPYATLNVNTNAYAPLLNPSSILTNPPVTVSTTGGVSTLGLALDSNFAVVSNRLGFSSIPAGSLLSNCANAAGEPTQCTWNNYANQAIGNADGLIPYRVGGVWGTATTGVAGHAIPFLDGTNRWTGVQTNYLGTSSLQTALAGALYRAANLDGIASLFEADAYGATGGFSCVRASGTAAVKLALSANDEICHMASHGYDGTAFSTLAAAYRIYASQAWTTSAHGTYARLGVTPNGATTMVDTFGLENDGGVTVPPAVSGGSMGAGTLNLANGLFNNGVGPTGTGGYVRAISPALTTPSLGLATGTSLALTGTTVSTSTTTGALTVAGGVGVAANLNVGTTVAAGAVGIGNTSPSAKLEVGSSSVPNSVGSIRSSTCNSDCSGSRTWSFGADLTNYGDYGFHIQDVTASAALRFGIDLSGNVFIPVTTASTSTTTGGLVVSGGLGVAGAINAGGGVSGATLGAKSASAFYMQIGNSETLTANRLLTYVLGDTARTVTLGGNLSIGGAFTTTPANGVTLTTTGTTGVTLPTTGTLATLAGVETHTNKSMSGSANTFTNIPNSALVNTGTTVNGVSCVLGTTCTVTAAASQVVVGTTTISSGTTNGLLYNNAGNLGNLATANNGVLVTGSGGTPVISSTLPSGIAATNMALTTPTLGVASATSINRMSITAPATGSTLTVADGKTFGVANSIALAGTDSTTMTLPAANAKLAALDVQGQVLSGGATVTSQALTSGNITVDCGSRPLQAITGSTSAWTITAPAADGSCMILLTNAASSSIAPIFSGFAVGSNTGATINNVSSAKFTIQVWRINGTSGYTIFAHQ